MTVEIIDTQILTQSLDSILDGQRSIDECLTMNPSYQEALQPLLNLATRLRQAGSLKMDAQYAQVAKTRLLRQLTDFPEQSKKTNSTLSERIAAGFHRLHLQTLSRQAVAIIILVFVMVFGSTIVTVVAAVDQSLPGDALYSFKTLFEQSRLFASSTDSNNAWLHLEFSGRRIDEIVRLAQLNRLKDIPVAVQAYDTELSAVTRSLGKESHLSTEEKDRLAKALNENMAKHQVQFKGILDYWFVYEGSISSEEIENAKTEIQKELSEIQSQWDWIKGLNIVFPPAIMPTVNALLTQAGGYSTPSPFTQITPSPSTLIPSSTELSPAEVATLWATEWPEDWPTDEIWTIEPSAQWTVFNTPWGTYILPTDILSTIETFPTILPTYFPNLPTNWPTVLPLPGSSWPPEIPKNWP